MDNVFIYFYASRRYILFSLFRIITLCLSAEKQSVDETNVFGIKFHETSFYEEKER